MPRLSDILLTYERRLAASGIANSAADLRVLVSQTIGLDLGSEHLPHDVDLDPESCKKLEWAVEQRERRVPIERIAGFSTFCGIKVRVTSAVFKPYLESGELVRRAVALAEGRMAPLHILDVGTGTGCILLALLKALPLATGVGTDVDESTIEVARQNARLNDMQERVAFRAGNWTEGIDEKFDVIVSNPPRTAPSELRFLPPETRQYEPRVSIDGGEDGLKFFRLLKCDFGRLARVGTFGLFQVTPNRAEATKEIFNAGRSLSADLQVNEQGRAFAVLVKELQQ